MSSSQDQWVAQIYRAHKTLSQMLNDRGYQVSKAQLETKLDDLKTKLQGNSGDGALKCEALDMIYLKKESEEEIQMNVENQEEIEFSPNKIVVYWLVDKEKVNAEMIKAVQVKAGYLGVLRAIIIVKE